MTCPCGKDVPYADCCGRYHSGAAEPETAEALMRSRYSAYARHHIDYLVATHDPERRSEFDAMNASNWSRDVDWKRLDILSRRKGQSGDDTGHVEFIAWFTTKDGLSCHHERSDFRKFDSKWVYVTGEGTSAVAVFASIPRNDLCPCGSGKKFKKCHGG